MEICKITSRAIPTTKTYSPITRQTTITCFRQTTQITITKRTLIIFFRAIILQIRTIFSAIPVVTIKLAATKVVITCFPVKIIIRITFSLITKVSKIICSQILIQTIRSAITCFARAIRIRIITTCFQTKGIIMGVIICFLILVGMGMWVTLIISSLLRITQIRTTCSPIRTIIWTATICLQTTMQTTRITCSRTVITLAIITISSAIAIPYRITISSLPITAIPQICSHPITTTIIYSQMEITPVEIWTTWIMEIIIYLTIKVLVINKGTCCLVITKIRCGQIIKWSLFCNSKWWISTSNRWLCQVSSSNHLNWLLMILNKW